MSSSSEIGMHLPLDGTWVGWFLAKADNSFLCRVPREFMKDKFNLIGLEYMAPEYPAALTEILDEVVDTEYGVLPFDVDPKLTAQLYGLLHVRYIYTGSGLEAMYCKYNRGDFGLCPRFHCEGQHVLPVGLSDTLEQDSVRVYCPKCNDIYMPSTRYSNLDGAMFGVGFPHMFFMNFPALRPQPPYKHYTPHLFGFRVHPDVLYAPSCDSPQQPMEIEATSTQSPIKEACEAVKHLDIK